MSRCAGLRGEAARLRCRFVKRLEVDLDLDLVADQDAVRYRHVPGEAEIRPIDRQRGGGTKVLPALSVGHDADQLDVEAHRTRDLADGEVAARRVVALALREDRVALESDLGVLLGVEEIRRLKVPVAPRVPGVDPLHRCGDLEVTLLGVLGVQLDPAADLAEAAANGGHHHVLHRKVHCRMGWVDVPEHMFSLSPASPGFCCWYNQLVAYASYSEGHQATPQADRVPRVARIHGRFGRRRSCYGSRSPAPGGARPGGTPPARDHQRGGRTRHPPNGPRTWLDAHQERAHPGSRSAGGARLDW